MKVFRAALAALLTASALVMLTPQVADAAPARVTANPFTGLVGGDSVTVTGTGLPARTTVDVVECSNPTHFNGDVRIGCDPLMTATTNARGGLSARARLLDPVYFNEEFGDPIPIYCRLDGCRVFIEWTDAAGLHSVGTRPLHFVGTIATITATPTANLSDGTRVHVTGSAIGSTGQFVTVVEHLCFDVIQGSGCEGTLSLGTFRLTAADTFSGDVTVFRTLAAGEDCATDTFFGPCTLTPVVLKLGGDPDDSFGVSSLGQPNVALAFNS